MVPGWLQQLTWLFLAATVASVAIVVIDIWAGRRHKMAIMNIVWPVTTLYFGPFGLWIYWKIGRPAAVREQTAQQPRQAA